MKTLNLIILFVLTSVTGFAQQKASSPKIHFDNEKWTEYIEGNMPFVISVPHGGRLVVDTLPVRDCKGAVVVTDGNTIELARAIQDYFQKEYKLTPHIIISHLSRKHLDQNRELDNGATCGNKQVEKTWYAFHNFVDSALNLATIGGKKTMYIDLHGHGHKNQRLEIGYNLSKGELNDILSDNFDEKAKNHSLANLLKSQSSLNFKEIIFGDNAFGTFLVNNEVPATPSKQDLVPTKDEAFFSGGDNTRRFTGKKYPNVFGLQIESDGTARRTANRATTAKGISEAVVQYLNLYAKSQIKVLKK